VRNPENADATRVIGSIPTNHTQVTEEEEGRQQVLQKVMTMSPQLHVTPACHLLVTSGSPDLPTYLLNVNARNACAVMRIEASKATEKVLEPFIAEHLLDSH